MLSVILLLVSTSPQIEGTFVEVIDFQDALIQYVFDTQANITELKGSPKHVFKLYFELVIMRIKMMKKLCVNKLLQ